MQKSKNANMNGNMKAVMWLGDIILCMSAIYTLAKNVGNKSILNIELWNQ